MPKKMLIDSIINKESRFLTIIWYGYGNREMPSLQFFMRFKLLMNDLEGYWLTMNLVKKIMNGEEE